MHLLHQTILETLLIEGTPTGDLQEIPPGLFNQTNPVSFFYGDLRGVTPAAVVGGQGWRGSGRLDQGTPCVWRGVCPCP